MEAISYGDVNLQVILTKSYLREDIRTPDDANYLYTRHVAEVVCQFNQGATSYTPPVDNRDPPVANTTSMPGMTDNALRQYMMQPRRLLKIVAGGQTILSTPSALPSDSTKTYACDAKNGPFCDVFGITQMIGTMHFVCHFRFTAHVVEYAAKPNNPITPITPGMTQLLPIPAYPPNVVLANQWVSSEDVDELGYPTRYFAGEAVLRTDLMRAVDSSNFNADSLRKTFFFPVPANYQRENVAVELSSDGSKLKWSFEDHAKPYNVGKNSPIRKIEAYKTVGVSAGGPSRAQAQFNLGLDVQIPTSRMGALMSAMKLITDRSKLHAMNLPRYYLHTTVQLWGARDANKAILANIALGICAAQMLLSNVNGLATVATWEIIIQQALHEKYVSVEITADWSEDLNMTIATPLLPSAAPIWQPPSGVPMSVGLANIALSAVSDTGQISAQNTASNGSYVVLDQTGNTFTDNPGYTDNCKSPVGALIVRLVSQVLQTQNQNVPSPLVPMTNF
jgi:hypothetical protein